MNENRVSVVDMTMSALGCKFKEPKNIILRMKPHFDKLGSTFTDCESSTSLRYTKLTLKFKTNIKFNNDDEVKQMIQSIFKPPSAKPKQHSETKGLISLHGYIIDRCALSFIEGSRIINNYTIE